MADERAGPPPKYARIVAHGEWAYDGTAQMPVYIVQTNFEFWYEVAEPDDRLEPDETPARNTDGCAFSVSFHDTRARARGSGPSRSRTSAES